MPAVVMIVENLPVPFDRRVWQEAKALRDAGWTVSVICPLNEKYSSRRETLEGIHIFRHPLPMEARGKLGFLVEYGAALFHEFRLLFKVRREIGFDVIHACNPPDLIFILALFWKVMRGTKFVFDHHDVCPELFEAKFGEKRGFIQNMLLKAVGIAEKLTFKTADLVISANETFRELAVSRGGKKDADTVSVYSVPDRTRFYRTEPNLALRKGKRIVIGYMGIINDQDGVDHVVEMAAHLKYDLGQSDFQCVIVGDGPALLSVKALCIDKNVSDVVTFTGYVSGADFLSALSTFDIGVIPDPLNPYNDKISMNKVFEYAAMGTPIVAFPLSETRRLLSEDAIFAQGTDSQALARAVLPLMNDDELRSKMGQAAKIRAEKDFNWDFESQKLVKAYARFFPSSS
jgi:glycosyltransferase involved in cell wall biosynthesis